MLCDPSPAAARHNSFCSTEKMFLVCFPKLTWVTLVENHDSSDDIIVQTDAFALLGMACARHALGDHIIVVADTNTWRAADGRVNAHVTCAHHILQGEAKATLAQARALSEACGEASGLLALGSGTINDLTKYAAHARNIPYIVLPTAASMNGYLSPTASLEEDGHKHSYATRSPVAVIADIGIIAAAPQRLAKAGLADTLCRTTVEADMLLSHLLLGSDYPRTLFDTLRAHEAGLLADIDGLARHTPEAITRLMRALLAGGAAMRAYGSSAPASQGEHMVAHTYELLYGNDSHRLSHGELIAVTTLTTARLQERMLGAPVAVRPLPITPERMAELFRRKHAESLHAAYSKKLLSETSCAEINARLTQQWDRWHAEISTLCIPASTLDRIYKQLSLPTTAREGGLELARYDNAVRRAYLTRERFGFLDLAAMNDKRPVIC